MGALSESRSIQAGPFEVTLEKEPDDFAFFISWTQQSDGLIQVQLKLGSPHLAVPGHYRLSWRVPLVDIHSFWKPGNDRSRTLPADWSEGLFRNQPRMPQQVVFII